MVSLAARCLVARQSAQNMTYIVLQRLRPASDGGASDKCKLFAPPPKQRGVVLTANRHGGIGPFTPMLPVMERVWRDGFATKAQLRWPVRLE